MVKVILDCFGGDHSPDANIDAALLALSELPDLSLILTGDETILREKLAGRTYDESRLEIVHAPEVITPDEKPTSAIRHKKESSLMKGIYLLRERDDIAGMVSIGSTGALVAAAVLRVGRLRNVERPAFCPILPTMKGGIVGICDTGANVDVSAEQLLRQAIMASCYLESVYEVKSPRVALLNIGTESEKGDRLRKEAYALLSESDKINFAGNMEARELLSGDYDVVVCDGFSGNVLIKSTEGACLEMLKMLKRDMMSRFSYKIGALFMKKMFLKEKEFMDYQNYGGSVLLGSSRVIVKGHGSGKKKAIYKCIEQVYKIELSELNAKIEKTLPIYEKHHKNEE